MMRDGEQPGFGRGLGPKLGNPAAGGFKDLLRDLLGEGGLALAHAEAVAKDRLQVGLCQQGQYGAVRPGGEPRAELRVHRRYLLRLHPSIPFGRLTKGDAT
jgi:hypothetical protein